MPIRWIAVVMLCLATSARAPAQDPPAEPPATAPAIDATTPRGALKLLSLAMEEGDVEAIRDLVLATDDRELRMLSAQIDQAQALAQLRAALHGTFGPGGVDEIMAGQPTPEAQYEAIDSADLQLDGDRAAIMLGQDVYEMKRIDGHWKVSLTRMANEIDPRMLEQSLNEMSAKSLVIRETADEIAAGTYKTTDEVAQALQAKLYVAMMRNASASEPAATQPQQR